MAERSSSRSPLSLIVKTGMLFPTCRYLYRARNVQAGLLDSPICSDDTAARRTVVGRGEFENLGGHVVEFGPF